MGRLLQTVAAVSCMQTLLMIFNVVFWIMGAGLILVGVYMKFSISEYLEMASYYNTSAPYVFIITGVVIIIVGTMACCCTAKGFNSLLYMYAIFLVIIFMVMIGASATGYMYRSQIKKNFGKGMMDILVHYNTSADSKIDRALDNLQVNLECCGVYSYEDWFKNNHTEYPGYVSSYCCKKSEDFCDSNLKNKENEKYIYTRGCYNVVITLIGSNLLAIGGGMIGVAFFQLIGFMLAFCLARNINKGRYEPVN